MTVRLQIEDVKTLKSLEYGTRYTLLSFLPAGVVGPQGRVRQLEQEHSDVDACSMTSPPEEGPRQAEGEMPGLVCPSPPRQLQATRGGQWTVNPLFPNYK